MAGPEILLRIAALESEVAALKQRLEEHVESKRYWVDDIYGAFANDPDFLEAMRLGRKYRESLRPKPAKRASKRATDRATRASRGAPKSATKRSAKRNAKRERKR
jgi:hypothetical protein